MDRSRGAWIGPGQDRIYALMTEFGVASYKQYVDGDDDVRRRQKYRYKGTIPLTMNPWRWRTSVPPFSNSPRCAKRFRSTLHGMRPKRRSGTRSRGLAGWTTTRCPNPRDSCWSLPSPVCTPPRLRSCRCCSSCSQMASAGGPSFVLGVKDAAEDERPIGGMGAIHHAIAAELGDVIRLSQPVRRIVQDPRGDRACRRCAGACPEGHRHRADSHRGADRLRPMLPPTIVSTSADADRCRVQDRTDHDEPFWRPTVSRGSRSRRGRPRITIDSCTDLGVAWQSTVITEGPEARRIGKLGVEERRKAVLAAVAERFGEKALTPLDYIEQNWSAEPYSGGGMIAHTRRGSSPNSGPSCEPCGIHWAGTESSPIMYGFIDGAVRSGERAAAGSDRTRREDVRHLFRLPTPTWSD